MNRRQFLSLAAGQSFAQSLDRYAMNLALQGYFKEQAVQLSKTLSSKTGQSHDFFVEELAPQCQPGYCDALRLTSAMPLYCFTFTLQHGAGNGVPKVSLQSRHKEVQESFLVQYASDMQATSIPFVSGRIIERVQGNKLTSNYENLPSIPGLADLHHQRPSTREYLIGISESSSHTLAHAVSASEFEGDIKCDFPGYAKILHPQSKEEQLVAETLKAKLVRNFSKKEIHIGRLPKDMRRDFNRLYRPENTYILKSLLSKNGRCQWATYELMTQDGQYDLILAENKKAIGFQPMTVYNVSP